MYLKFMNGIIYMNHRHILFLSANKELQLICPLYLSISTADICAIGAI